MHSGEVAGAGGPMDFGSQLQLGEPYHRTRSDTEEPTAQLAAIERKRMRRQGRTLGCGEVVSSGPLPGIAE
jgi:hypothetical protein